MQEKKIVLSVSQIVAWHIFHFLDWIAIRLRTRELCVHWLKVQFSYISLNVNLKLVFFPHTTSMKLFNRWQTKNVYAKFSNFSCLYLFTF